MISEPILFIQDLMVILLAATVCGYLCSRIGLSPIVGYLVAGLIVGTPEITVPYVTDEARIHIIAQLGVVFLMFAIGLQFRLRRLRELGVRIILAVAFTALFMLSLGRAAGDILGMSPVAGLCLAAVFMVSSSAIISKVIHDQGSGHFRFGKVALGMTLMDDIVAVVMLAVLGTYGIADQVTPPIPLLLTMLLGFAVTVLVLGLVLVPRIFRELLRRGQSEISNIFVCAVLLLLAYVAVRAGYSLALGAFLFGLIVAETRQRAMVERAFQGLKDVFLTVFFVTIGMLIDVHAIPAVLPWILLGTAGALIGRTGAAFTALVLVGEHPRVAFQAGVALTPIGEFSFIIAGLAVASGFLSETFQVAAVGAALLTGLISPMLIQHSERLSRFLTPERAPSLDRWYGHYVAFLQKTGPRGSGEVLWNLLRRRIIQVLRDMLIVTALLLFAAPVHATLSDTFWGESVVVSKGFWVALAFLCLLPLIAVWRNLSAMAMLMADFIARENPATPRLAAGVKHGLHLVYLLVLGLWLWNLLPVGILGWGSLAVLGGLAILAVALAWRPMNRWHSELENALNETLDDSASGGAQQMIKAGEEGGWDYEVEEFVLPDDTAFAGVPLGSSQLRSRTGVSVVGIDRSGHTLRVVGPTTHLFPGDHLLVLGNREQLEKARTILAATAAESDALPHLEDLILRTIEVPEQSPLVGQTLTQLDLPRRFGVQVVDLRRLTGETVRPQASTEIRSNDKLLLIGTAGDFDRWMAEGKGEG